ncbi:MAG: hypothetical protein AB9835_08520 [Eubacteriales bacterium]
MRLKLLSCVLAITIALSSAIGATFAFFSDYESASFTVSAASLEMSLSGIDTGSVPPVMQVTVTNNGTINADLYLTSIYRQKNAAAESEMTAQYGIDIRDFFKDVTLNVSYQTQINSFSIKDLDDFSQSLLLMNAIAPGDSAVVTIIQNPGSVITQRAPETVMLAPENTGRMLSDLESAEDTSEASTEDDKTVADTSASTEEIEKDEPLSEDTAETEPSFEPTSEGRIFTELLSEFLSEDKSETEPAIEPSSEDIIASEPSTELPSAQVEESVQSDEPETQQPVQPSSEDIIKPEKSAMLFEEETSETQQSSEPSEPEEDNLEPEQKAPAKAARSFGHYEKRSVYVPYVFEFGLRGSNLSSTTEKTGFTIIKIFEIFVASPQPEAVMSLQDEAAKSATDETEETTALVKDITEDTGETTFEANTVPSEPIAAAYLDYMDEPEQERAIESSTEPPTEATKETLSESSNISPTEPSLDVPETIDESDTK